MSQWNISISMEAIIFGVIIALFVGAVLWVTCPDSKKEEMQSNTEESTLITTDETPIQENFELVTYDSNPQDQEPPYLMPYMGMINKKKYQDYPCEAGLDGHLGDGLFVGYPQIDTVY